MDMLARESRRPQHEVGRFVFVTGRCGTFLARTETCAAVLMSQPP